jgi:hypothetical protein
VVTGGADGVLSLYVFNGMNKAARPSRTTDDTEAHYINCIAMGKRGDVVLVAPASSQGKEREGEKNEYDILN